MPAILQATFFEKWNNKYVKTKKNSPPQAKFLKFGTFQIEEIAFSLCKSKKTLQKLGGLMARGAPWNSKFANSPRLTFETPKVQPPLLKGGGFELGSHIKPFFTAHSIPTLPSIILTEILILWTNCIILNIPYHFQLLAWSPPSPVSMVKLVKILIVGYKSIQHWSNLIPYFLRVFAFHKIHVRNYAALRFYKTKIINTPINLFKMQAKSFMQKLQTEGRCNEWEGKNAPCFFPGLPRIYRKNGTKVSYVYE